MQEEVFTPPRGGRQVPESQGVQSEANSGKGQRNFRSPIEMLVNTVSHMQRDLAILRDENRTLRTPATSQVIQAPRRAALTTTEVPRFDGTTTWEQYHQVFEAIVRSNGWDNDTAALQLFSLSIVGATVVTIRFSGCINGPLWFSGSADGL